MIVMKRVCATSENEELIYASKRIGILEWEFFKKMYNSFQLASLANNFSSKMCKASWQEVGDFILDRWPRELWNR